MKTESGRNALLRGIGILDLANEKASFCTKLLADMGARVIKVERPGGDACRDKGPFIEKASQPTRSLSFFYNNTNKLSITLDLERKEAKVIFLELVQKTDVLVETFPPGYLKRIGLDYETLSRFNSKLILVSVTGFGQNGPRMEYKACDLVASAYGGQIYVSGSPTTPPLKAFGNQSYYSASLFAATGIMLALRHRTKTGKGDHIDVSLQESVTATLEHVMIRYFSESVIQRRQGSLHWNGDFVVLPCKDGFIHVTLFQQWETLIEWLDGEGMAQDLKDEKWLADDYRRKHISHVIEILKRWTAAHTINEIFEVAQLMRFPWAPVQSPTEVLNCPQLNARNFFVETHHPESGSSLKYPGIPYRIDGKLDSQNTRAPLPGQHNDMIYNQELGIPEDNLKHLHGLNVV